jgi:3-deoxy-D-manno-octulosonic-acid transferase
MTNFREIAELTLNYQAGIQVDSTAGLTDVCLSLIDDVDLKRTLGENGVRMMRENGGSMERHMEVIAGFIR